MSLPSMSPSLPICMEGLETRLWHQQGWLRKKQNLGSDAGQLELRIERIPLPRAHWGQVLSQTRAPHLTARER